MTTAKKTNKTFKKFTSLFLALTMLLSVFGGFNLTAFAQEKELKESDVLLDTWTGQLVSHMNADEYSITIGSLDCIELVATSDIPMDIRIRSDFDSDPSNISKKFTDVTKHTQKFLECRGTFTILISRGADGCSQIGNYTVKLYNRTPKTGVSQLTAKKNGFTANYYKRNGVTGYQVQYSTDSSFTKKNRKTATVKGAKNTSKTVNKLKANKKYYVRVRTYTVVDGKRYYSAWSKAKTVTTKK